MNTTKQFAMNNHPSKCKDNVKNLDVLATSQPYSEGNNATESLRKKIKIQTNTLAIIETAYDLQAGTYNKYSLENPEHAARYAIEIATILDKNITKSNIFLDIVSGELTTLSLLTSKLLAKIKKSLLLIVVGQCYSKGLILRKYIWQENSII